MAEVQRPDKHFRISASDGVQISFLPIFVVNEMKEGETKLATNKDVECTMVHVEMKDKDGKATSMDLSFQELFMFVYFCCNEELRQQLQFRQEKHITEIPYEITFKLDKAEMAQGMAKRLIKLPVDEITMAIVRSEAQLLSGKANLSKVNEWFAKRTQMRKRSNKLVETALRKD